MFFAERDDGMIIREGRAVERLVRILRDPYLERVVLKTPVEEGPQPEAYHLTIGQDMMSLIDARMEDVTRLIDCRRGDYRRVYSDQVRNIRIY